MGADVRAWAIRNLYGKAVFFLVRARVEGENASFPSTSTGLLFPAISDSRCVPTHFCTNTSCVHTLIEC